MKIFTERPLENDELLLRAVLPPDEKPSYWKGSRLSSAAFKDPKGLSVSRVYDRSLSEAATWMRSNFRGPIFSITVQTCYDVDALVISFPSEKVPYHYEIHGSRESKILSDKQALLIARSAREVAAG